MPRRRTASRNPGSMLISGEEWIGGRLVSPFYITEDTPFRPDMILWLERPSDLIVGTTLIDPREPPVSVAQTLLDAMRKPLAGPPRRPRRVRVADASLAAELRPALGGRIPILVAPTPELDRVMEMMAESMPGGERQESYLEGGRVSPATVGRLFRAARTLYRAAPWTVAADGQLLRLDIPQLEVTGACVSIIGALTESRGLIIFPSLDACENFAQAGMARRKGGRSDLGTTLLALTFERGADLPPSMRREVVEHAWPVAGPRAYPRVQGRDRDGMSRPLTERDIRIATVCASALAAFFVRHREMFERGRLDPVCESFTGKEDITVRFTAPYEATSLFETDDLPPSSPGHPMKVGRNEPCPCGSGRKYKKCHLKSDEAVRSPVPGKDWVHGLDERVVADMMGYAAERFADEWKRWTEDFVDVEAALRLSLPWSVYHFLVRGRPVVDWFIEEASIRLTSDERAWLEAQRQTWLSVWEVVDVEAGISLTMKDLLTDETRHVRETSASETLVKRDAVLTRVVDYDGRSVLCGTHPRSLTPLLAAEVVHRLRSRLRRRRAVPVERLRGEAVGRYLISLWEKSVATLDLRRLTPPRLQNTEGDQLLLTADHFAFDPALRADVEAQLSTIEGVSPPEEGQEDGCYTFLRPGNPMHGSWTNTVVGTVWIADGKLKVDTNSRQRADDLRARIEAVCGDPLRHRAREHSDPRALFDRAELQPAPPRSLPLAEEERLVRESKERYYADWVDQPLPAFGGQAPRAAVRTRRGREEVDAFLKELENHESRLPEGQRFDFSRIRRAFGLEP